ncbi:MAG: S1C family serine protease, partial [Balneolaceae bacterium]
MKKRDYILTGILLILIGILLGLIISMFRSASWPVDLSEVKITEIKRSEAPFWNSDDLEKIDSRFLFQSIARDVKPAVVYIETIVPVNNRRITGREEGDDSRRFWDRFLPPRARTVGSGVIISEDGYVLTNNHVIAEAISDGITVTLDDKKTFEARIVGKDPSTDLAVLKIDAVNLPAMIIGNSDLLEVGEWVLAIGNPFRLRSTVTAGIVSALSRDVDIIDDLMRIESFIQTDAAINRGNSGGALVNTSGELIGINTAIATQSGNYQGYGFAVPSNLALKVARDIIEFGEVKRGMLGVTIESVTSAIAEKADLDVIKGVYIVDTTEDGAARKADLRAADIILEVNSFPVNEVNELQEKVAMYRPGDIVYLKLWRNGMEIYKSVELKELKLPFQPEEPQ